MADRPLLQLLRQADRRPELLLQAEMVDRLRVLLPQVGMVVLRRAPLRLAETVDRRQELLPQAETVDLAVTRQQQRRLQQLEKVPLLPLLLVEVLLLRPLPLEKDSEIYLEMSNT